MVMASFRVGGAQVNFEVVNPSPRKNERALIVRESKERRGKIELSGWELLSCPHPINVSTKDALQCSITVSMEFCRIQILLCGGFFCYSSDDLDTNVVEPE